MYIILFFISSIVIIAIIYYIHNKLYTKKMEYHSLDYWESRYNKHTTEMDWYVNFNKLCNDFQIGGILTQQFPNKKKCKILELGCGNSSLAHDISEFGYKQLTSIDFSSIIIDRMKNKFSKDNINCIYIILILYSCPRRFY